MPKFTYTGEDHAGAEITQTVEAVDRYAVYEIARGNGHTVKMIEERGSFDIKSIFNVEKIEYMISRVSLDDLVLVTRNLGAMLRAGLPLTRALSVVERQSSNPRLKGIMIKIRERINKGDPFASTLEEFPETFSDLYVAMVRAGEEGGTLADTLEVLSTQLERASNLRKKVKGAMIYPAIVLCIMVGIGILMMMFVMPSITDTFLELNVDLPATTQFLINASTFFNNNILLTLGLMFASVAGFWYALGTTYGKIAFHYVIRKLPVIGNLVKETNAARTARTLSSLLTSGVDVINALTITRDVVQNVHYKKIIDEAAKRVESGKPLSETFIEYNDMYPVLVGEMISVGEETGQISKMLGELAVFYENEVEQKTDNMSTIIEPVMMVVIGGSVGVFALAMIAPIYSIGENL